MTLPLACPQPMALQYTAWMQDEAAARGDVAMGQRQDDALRQLMSAAQDGDQDAYGRLLRQIIPIIRSCARRHCQNAADIEELVQDTLLTVHRVRHTYDPRRAFLPWLTAIAVRRSIDGLRRRVRIGRHEASELTAIELEEAEGLQDRTDSAQASAEAASAGSRLTELLQRLPARQREALQMLKLQEMSLAEAALASGQTVGALKVNVHRALRRLRGLVSEGR